MISIRSRRLMGVVIYVFQSVGFAYAQLPRPLGDAVRFEYSEFPIPFPGRNNSNANIIAFSKDGSLLATAAESTIVVWEIETRQIVAQMQLPEKQAAIDVAFADDGKSL